MLDKNAGIPTQIRNLERRLKDIDTSKAKPAKVKEITDLIKDLKEMLREKMEKREQRKKDKASKVQEVESAASTTMTTTTVSPVAPGTTATPGTAPTTPQSDDAPSNAPDDASPNCALCGGITFADYAGYQNHMEYTHASDTMPTSPTQKLDPTIASVETDAAPATCPICAVKFNSFPDYEEHKNETHSRNYQPMDYQKKKDTTKNVEKKLGPAVIGDKEEKKVEKKSKPTKFDLDQKVKPVRGSDSMGRVMRHDGPDDLCYVAWDEGPLKDRDVFGGYYSHELEAVEEPKQEVTSEIDHMADLKQNYEGFLKDLEDERKAHADQGNHPWVARLDQKIDDLKKQMEEKFPTKKEAASEPMFKCINCDAPMGPHSEQHLENLPDGEQKWNCNKKEAGAQNAEELTIMDHTPPRANVTMDEGGHDGNDEFQDQWANPDGRDLNAGNTPASPLFDVKTAPHVVDQLKSHVNAPFINAYPSTLGGDQNVSIMLTISADPQDKWANGILQNSRYGNFHIYNDGTVEQFAGSFAGWKQPNRAFRKSHVNSVEQLVGVLNAFLAKVNPAPKAASLKTASIPVTVFKRNWKAEPVNKEGKIGYDVLDEKGTKILHISPINGKEMNSEHLKWATERELTKGLKQARLIEKIAFIPKNTKVYVLATDAPRKRVKLAFMEQNMRIWAPISKIAYIAKEGELRKHQDHIDNTFGHNGKEVLVDCPNGSGNMKFVAMGELLPIQQPPATPESLNDLESSKQEKCSLCKHPATEHSEARGCAYKGGCGCTLFPTPQKQAAQDCADCHGNFVGAEGDKCPTCGRFAVQKEALKQALPPQIIPQRWDANAALKQAAGCDQCAATMINGVFCHETGCPNARKKKPCFNCGFDECDGNCMNDVESSLKKETKQSTCKHCKKDKIINEMGVDAGVCDSCADSMYRRDYSRESSLKKSAHIRHENGKWIVYNHDYTKKLGTYPSKEAAEKRLRQIEYFKHQGSIKPFCKKEAEVLINPYQSLSEHITDMRSRMTQVQEKIQSSPVPKTAGEGETDNSSMDLPALFEDLSMGIDLLETKLSDEMPSSESGDLHESLEKLENLLWEVEMKAGITPKLPEHEKEEPEHKEIVKEVEEKVEKEADVVTDETIVTNDPNAIPPATLATTAPVIQNVQPTDQDNLEVPVAKPSSPPAPGQIWVYNSDPAVMAYVSMPDPANPRKTV